MQTQIDYQAYKKQLKAAANAILDDSRYCFHPQPASKLIEKFLET